MRKYLLLIIAICLVAVLLVGCGVQPQTPANQPTQGDGDNNTEVNTDKDPEQGNEDDKSQADGEKEPEQGDNGENEEVLYSKSGRTCEEDDAYILSMWHEPTMQDEFDDDTVNFLFRYTYVGTIGYGYFQDLTDTQVVQISAGDTVLAQGEGYITKYKGESALFQIKLSTHDKQIVLDTIKTLMEREEILVAEPKYQVTVSPLSVPSDAYYYLQESLTGTYGINAESAWDYTIGSSSVNIGVMEGGIDYSHADLYGHVFNASNSDAHGTLVSGIIGAIRNSIGIAGVAQCNIYCLDNSVSNLSQVIAYANDATNEGHRIKIINASFCYTLSDQVTAAPFNAEIYNTYKSYDGLIICAAGNYNLNNDYALYYPASFDLSNIIAVGASNSYGFASSFSNYGLTTVDLFAPGEGVLSTYPEDSCINQNCTDDYSTHYQNGYHFCRGTSFAAPLVTGVAALLLSYYPTMTSEQIKLHIMGSVTQTGYLGMYCVTGGVLNAGAAMQSVLATDYSDVGDDDYHYYLCTTCNGVHGQAGQAHSYGAYTYNSPSKHSKVCSVCGHEVLQTHGRSGSCVNLGEFVGHNAYCSICSSNYVEPHTWVFLPSDWKYHCMYCPAKSATGESPYGIQDEYNQ